MKPDYLQIDSAELGQGQPVKVRIVRDNHALAAHLADSILDEIRSAPKSKGATLVVPVGPVDQFPVLAEAINRQGISCRDAMFINMDEYLDSQDQWIALDHPLSFRAFMEKNFYSLLDPELAPPEHLRVFPDPKNPSELGSRIADRGGVDAVFGGIGINCHIAFNEPPEPGELGDLDSFLNLPTRNLDLSRETRTINSVTVGGEISVIPHRAVTIGMREIMAARRLRFYCNRPWQSAVVRRVLHGPVCAAAPASCLRLHSDAAITVTELVASRPDIRLR